MSSRQQQAENRRIKADAQQSPTDFGLRECQVDVAAAAGCKLQVAGVSGGYLRWLGSFLPWAMVVLFGLVHGATTTTQPAQPDGIGPTTCNLPL